MTYSSLWCIIRIVFSRTLFINLIELANLPTCCTSLEKGGSLSLFYVCFF